MKYNVGHKDKTLDFSKSNRVFVHMFIDHYLKNQVLDETVSFTHSRLCATDEAAARLRLCTVYRK